MKEKKNTLEKKGTTDFYSSPDSHWAPMWAVSHYVNQTVYILTH